MSEEIDNLEDVVVGKYERMTGVVPVGFRDMLHILTHPDMLEPLLEYAQAKVKQDLEYERARNDEPIVLNQDRNRCHHNAEQYRY